MISQEGVPPLGSTGDTHNRWLILVLVLLVAFLAAAGGFYYAFSKNQPKDLLDGKQTIDLHEEAKEAHRTMDKILLQKKLHWQLQDKARDEVTEKIRATGGEVTWVKRQLAIGVPVTTDLQGAADWVKDKLANTTVKVVSERRATYEKNPAYRLDVGIEVKAGKGSKLYTTDTIYFFANSNLTNRDADIVQPVRGLATNSDKYQGKLALIVTECGPNQEALRKFLALDYPFAYAILPYKSYSQDTLRLVKEKGRDALLYLPMEAVDAKQNAGLDKAVLTTMDENTITNQVKAAVDSMPGVAGLINYHGSKATADTDVMQTVLQVAKDEQLYFVDNATTFRSVGMQEARKLGVPTGKNILVLDNVADLDTIHAQMEQAMELADRFGSAIVVCQARFVTTQAWSLFGKEITSEGIEIVPVADLLD